ncbi:MAG: PDZ domain-containing protein [Planctomycetota bacterium JB042]
MSSAIRPEPTASSSLPTAAGIVLALVAFVGDAFAQPAGGRRSPWPPEQREALLETGRAMTRHLVRVRIELQPVIHRVDGLKIDRPWVLEGTCGGLVVAPEPLILISGSSCRPDHAGILLGVASGLSDPPKRRYTLLLDRGVEVPATIRRHDRAINVLLLGPAPGAALPESFPPPVSFEGITRPRSGELLGLAALVTPDRNDRVVVTPFTLAPGKDAFARPALTAAGLHQLGMPVFFGDGRLAGLANLPPPEEGVTRPRVDLEAARGTEGERDPLEWATGYRRPVLMSEEDLGPLVEFLTSPSPETAAPEPERRLGLSLHPDGGRLRVDTVDEDGPAARAGVIAGEEIASLGDREVSTVAELAEALDAALADGDEAVLVVLRDGRPVELVVSVETPR